MPNKISVVLATAIGLGAIIGAGIFVLSGTAIALAGRNALIAFLLVGIVALIVGLELSELGSIMPRLSGASYSYAYKAFGSELGFITGILFYFSYATGISVVALGFGSYLSSLLGFGSAAFPIAFAMLLIFVLSLVNILGIKKAAKADFALVVVKIAILAIFIAFAFIVAFSMKAPLINLETIAPASSGLAAIFEASVVIFFAYSGFQTISTLTKNIEGGSRGAARAIIAAVLISIVLYVLVVFGLMLLLPASHYTISADPLSSALQASNAPYWLFILVGIGALIATASATLAYLLSSSRTLHQMGTDKLLPKFTRAYDRKRDVATNGVIISAVIGVIMLFSGNIYVIAAISNFGLLFSYLMASFSVLHFRRKNAAPSFKTPFYPYLPIIAIVALMAFLIGLPKEALLIGMGLIITLIMVYYTLREYENKKVVTIRLFK
ncbi:MAG: APC family permease [Candidatus Micrarchaeaceae archaeon]|jgi:APA family basic amino acid/polyamine antiporter|nr:amino acid permease [Candidatus Micrarchaeota archaeon]HII09645.1 amino acid permease [Candidatus Micrarchaeota archaeon]